MSSCGAVSSESLVAKQPGVGKGKVAIVTGANTGIGKHTAQALAQAGFNVVIAGRNLSALETAKKDIESALKSDGDGRITILKSALDLSSAESIKTYVHDFLEQKLPLHVLVNNAGAADVKGKTKEGLEYIMGVNWFGTFLLTSLLLDSLKASAPARIVNVSSRLYAMGNITLDNMDKVIHEGNGDPLQGYRDGKLGAVMHARELARRYKDDKIYAFSLHPGIVATDMLGRHMGCCMRCVCFGLLGCCFRSPSQGASNTVLCAIGDVEAHSGAYFMDCRPQKPTPNVIDKVAEALFDKGDELVRKFAQPQEQP